MVFSTWYFQVSTWSFLHGPIPYSPFHRVHTTRSFRHNPFQTVPTKQFFLQGPFYRVLSTWYFQHGPFYMVSFHTVLFTGSIRQGPFYIFLSEPSLSQGTFYRVLCFNMFLSKKCFPQGPFLALFYAAWKFFSILYSLPFPVFPSTLRDQHLWPPPLHLHYSP